MVIRRPVLEYITNNEAKGYSLEDIRESLIRAGYEERDVIDTIKEAERRIFEDSHPKPKLYATFWMRLLAGLIDTGILVLTLGFFTGMVTVALNNLELDPLTPWAIIPVVTLWIVVPWLYYALYESGKHQATPGKHLIGLQVERVEGFEKKTQLSFAQATGRHYATYLSGAILGAGYLMILWTENHRGLHDILSHTVVIIKQQ